MRRRLALLVLPLLLSATLSAQTPAKAVDITGKWVVVMELSIGTSNPTLTFKQEQDPNDKTKKIYVAEFHGTIRDSHARYFLCGWGNINNSPMHPWNSSGSIRVMAD